MALRIGLGVARFPFTAASAFWDWIALCEASPVDSVWLSDRLVTRDPFPECMSILAAIAGATNRLKFGMSVLSLGLRDPFMVAHQCATIDFLSNGRLLPAFGLGSPSSPDWKALGIDPTARGTRMDEALEIISRLWRGETVDWDSPFFRYASAQISPLPKQSPLPLWIGGSSKAAIRRTGRFGTGWLAGLEDPATVKPVVRAIHAEARLAGRSIDPEHFGAGFFYRIDNPQSADASQCRQSLGIGPTRAGMEKSVIIGDANAIIAHIHAYEAAGISKFVLRPLGVSDSDIMDQTQRLVDQILPAVHGKPARLPQISGD